MLSAIASVVSVGAAGEDETEMSHRIDAIMDTLADPAGTFYRFSMAHSLLRRVRVNGNGSAKGEAK
jgi:F420-non-reducing hydrogenase small subunit